MSLKSPVRLRTISVAIRSCMKAAVHTQYGSPDVIQIRDIEKSVPGDNEVSIKVRAASVNPIDWHYLRGTPYIARIMFGLRKPKVTRLGIDVAGRVEAVGRKVTQFKPGDDVFGTCRGAFAEYVCTPESTLIMKPDNVTFEQAAAAPVAAFTALQGLRGKGRIQPGHNVLINGAAGGVGTFAVQIAKQFGAHVTGVCSTRNVDMVRSIGADQVIDYTREDFARSGGQLYDIIFDCFVNHSLSEYRRILKPQGTYIIVGGPSDPWMIGAMAVPIKAFVLSRFVSQKFVMFIASSVKEDLTTMRELLETERVRPVIDRRYRLNEVPGAIRYLEEGHARGKVVITLD